jgi:hypothetical protein
MPILAASSQPGPLVRTTRVAANCCNPLSVLVAGARNRQYRQSSMWWQHEAANPDPAFLPGTPPTLPAGLPKVGPAQNLKRADAWRCLNASILLTRPSRVNRGTAALAWS